MAIENNNNEPAQEQVDPDERSFRRWCLEKRLEELQSEEKRIVEALTSL